MFNPQKNIGVSTYAFLTEDSGTTHRLIGSAPQTLTGPPVVPPAAPSGTRYCIVNQGSADATWTPLSPQTVNGATSITITPRQALTLELCGSDWVEF